MENDGYELAARFSYITNALNYCGPKDNHKEFYNYIIGKKDDSASDLSGSSTSLKDSILHSIKRFEALYPYLKFIAEKTGKDILDYEVVEAYWIGNRLLEQFSKEDMNKLVLMLISRGLPKSLGDKLILQMPKLGIPYHTFHVFYIGVGNVTGHVETTLQNMDNCRISVGKILDIVEGHLIVETDSLIEKEGKLWLINDTKTIIYDKKMLPSIGVDDTVAIHWGFACKILSEIEIDNIKKYTLRALDAKNSLKN
jgi:hypothetical protein